MIRLTPLEAERKLKRILGAVIEGANLRRKGRTRHQSEIKLYFDLLYSDFDDAYFELLCTILKEDETKRCERHKTNWKSRIGIRLRVFKPNLDHQLVLTFLSARTLPKHRTGRSLRNAFFAWSRGIKSRTFSKYKSQGLKQKQKRTAEFRSTKYDLADEDKAIDAITTGEYNRILLNLGFGKVDSYFDVRSSNLVWEEGLPSQKRLPKSCQDKPSHLSTE